jgi:hypothetical protein
MVIFFQHSKPAKRWQEYPRVRMGAVWLFSIIYRGLRSPIEFKNGAYYLRLSASLFCCDHQKRFIANADSFDGIDFVVGRDSPTPEGVG